jgi:hypothetical protein
LPESSSDELLDELEECDASPLSLARDKLPRKELLPEREEVVPPPPHGEESYDKFRSRLMFEHQFNIAPSSLKSGRLFHHRFERPVID